MKWAVSGMHGADCGCMLQVVVEILSELDIGQFVVKLNHRRLLDAMMDLCGVPPAKFRAICRSSVCLCMVADSQSPYSCCLLSKL